MPTSTRLDALRAMVAQHPDNALARFGLANELLKAQEWEDAATELSKYLESYDDEGNGWLRYVDVLRTLGRDDEARAAVDRGMDAAGRFGHATLVAEFQQRLDEWDDF